MNDYRLVPYEILTPGYIGEVTCTDNNLDTGIDTSNMIYLNSYCFSSDFEHLYEPQLKSYVSTDEQQSLYIMTPIIENGLTGKIQMNIQYMVNQNYASSITFTFSGNGCYFYQNSASMGLSGSITFYGVSDGWEGEYNGIYYYPIKNNFTINIIVSAE